MTRDTHTHRETPSDHYDLAIVGGGVIGLSVAWECGRRGYQVVVLDDTPSKAGGGGQMPSHQTSWAAAGILPPASATHATDPIDQLRGHSHAIWPDWCAQLKSQTGIDTGYRNCGGLYLATTAGEAALMAGMVAYWNDLQLACHAWKDDEIIARFPILRHGIQNLRSSLSHDRPLGWWTNEESQIRPPRLLAALRQAIQSVGVHFAENTRVDQLDDGAGHVLVLLQAGADITAERVVLCGGAATGQVHAADSRMRSSLIPIRGQILLLHDPAIDFDGIVNVGNQYLLGRGDGDVLVGSCEEEVGFQPGTTDEVIESLRQFAVTMVPSLAAARETSRWSGLRPMTFDGFPMIGPVPGRPRIWVATGHYRSGISLAPGTAVAIADQLDGRDTFMSMDAFEVAKQLSHSTSTPSPTSAPRPR